MSVTLKNTVEFLVPSINEWRPLQFFQNCDFHNGSETILREERKLGKAFWRKIQKREHENLVSFASQL